MAQLVHELAGDGAARLPTGAALRCGAQRVSYAALAATCAAFGAALETALGCGERVAVRLAASPEAVAALLGTAAAGCVFVAVDPGADLAACTAVLRDCDARVLVTDSAEAASLAQLAAACPALHTVVLRGPAVRQPRRAGTTVRVLGWDAFLALPIAAPPAPRHPCTALAALVYGASRGGRPRAVALSHRNLVAGAAALARCLGIVPGDRLHCTLPLHGGDGLEAMLACLAAGATAVLAPAGATEHLAAMLERGELTGLLATPAELGAIARIKPRGAAPCLRVLGCTGGKLDLADLEALRQALPRTRMHLFHSGGDAGRAFSLLPAELDERPGTIGRPLPYSEWKLVRPDGRACGAGETGELVRCGALVPLAYWKDARASAEHLRRLPPAWPQEAAHGGASESGYWPGMLARRDADGFLYPVALRGEIIVTGGYRVDSQEVERIVAGTGLVAETAAVGVAHPVLGQVIALLATARPGARLDSATLFGACRARLPRHMLPAMVDVRRRPLPRAGDGQIDRVLLAGELAPLFAEAGR